MSFYIRTLSIRDLEQCDAVESAAFPPDQAASRDKIEYRLTVCPEICLGLFCRGEPSLPIQLPDDIPYLANASESDEDTLFAHTISTKSTTRPVKDQDMDFPRDWKTNPLAENEVGHQPKGRTIALHALAVSPKYQKSGLGKALMKSYITQMKEADQADRISILTYDRLVPYYQGLGFENYGKSESNYAGVAWYDLIELDPQHLFRKIVTDNRGRGGFCMEIAILYNHVLRAAGFDAYTAGVRTRGRLEGVPQGDYPGWNHIINVVTLPDGSKYHADVAFGGDGALFPMPLVDGLVHQNLGTQQIRLVRDWIPHQVHRTEESKLWIYQYRNGADRDWNSFYSFPGIEFYTLDWGVVNFWIGNHPSSHQRVNLLVIKFLRRPKQSGGDEEEYEIYGKRMLVNGVVKENLGGRTHVITECKSETERLQALENYFSILLDREEEEGIRGKLRKRHLSPEEIPRSPFLLGFDQRLAIAAHIHPPQLVAVSHQELVPALLRVRPHAELLVSLVVADPRDELFSLVVANVRARDGVAEAQPPVLLHASPVEPALGAEAGAQLQLPVDERDDQPVLAVPDDEDLVRARHGFVQCVEAVAGDGCGCRRVAAVAVGCGRHGHGVAELDFLTHWSNGTTWGGFWVVSF
ncbi:hypothetical protein AK830_g9294 [Neonectria ditissima]|uniref:N-acetyltransferase domain-containing protein n=1 Tax=Neonectria ditissima TaxID=78410 RepID=A0A0P7AII8_9HYPO|nr:hypothetical protein AK830_g9294 [Neonectria ditissima]